MSDDRRKNDEVLQAQLRELTKTVSELVVHTQVQTQALDQHKEVARLHVTAVEKALEALKTIVYEDIKSLGELENRVYKRFSKEDDRVKKIESRMDKAEGAAVFAKIMWGVCGTLLGGLIWLLTKMGVLS